MTTTFRIPHEQIRAHLERICVKNGWTLKIEPLPWTNPAPYRWRIAVVCGEGAMLAGAAVREDDEVPDAIESIWSEFVRLGLA